MAFKKTNILSVVMKRIMACIKSEAKRNTFVFVDKKTCKRPFNWTV